MKFWTWLKSLFVKPEIDRPDPDVRIIAEPTPSKIKEGVGIGDLLLPDHAEAQGPGRKIDETLFRQLCYKVCDIFGYPEVRLRLDRGELNWIVWAASHAIVELDVKEVPRNSNSGPLVSAIQDTVGGREAWPWCASFVQTAVAFAERLSGKTSPLFASEHVWTMHAKSKLCWTARPITGSIFCLNYPPGQSGHTGILRDITPDGYRTEEGNTATGLDARGLPAREGGGAYHCLRTWRFGSKLKLLGWLKAFPDTGE